MYYSNFSQSKQMQWSMNSSSSSSFEVVHDEFSWNSTTEWLVIDKMSSNLFQCWLFKSSISVHAYGCRRLCQNTLTHICYLKFAIQIYRLMFGFIPHRCSWTVINFVRLQSLRRKLAIKIRLLLNLYNANAITLTYTRHVIRWEYSMAFVPCTTQRLNHLPSRGI